MKLNPQKKRLYLITIMISGILFFAMGSSHILYQRTVLSFTEPVEVVETVNESVASPVSIYISGASISLPVEPGSIDDKGIWEISDTGASYLNTAAKPGEGGNIVVYGHNKRHLFGPLTLVKVGDEISLETEDGQSHLYRVTKTTTVTPDQIDLVMPTDYEVLTVYTCTGWLDRYRFIVRAEPIISQTTEPESE